MVQEGGVEDRSDTDAIESLPLHTLNRCVFVSSSSRKNACSVACLWNELLKVNVRFGARIVSLSIYWTILPHIPTV